MDFRGYPMQILIVVAKGCRPNSPYVNRSWTDLKPSGRTIPQLRRARNALVMAGLIEDQVHGSWTVRPTRLGYVAYSEWKIHRQKLKERPAMFDPIIKNIVTLDQRFDRFAA